MAKKFPPPSPPFIQARFRGGRQVPKAIVMHGTVTADDKGTARNVARWWAGPTSPVSSAHYTVDPGEVIQSVGDHTIAYHCGYNKDSIGVELCDEQVGPASRWRDADSTAILKRAARLVAELCLAYDIEPVRPTTAALKAKGPHGIYGHNDSRLAFGGTTHSDPRDFPWAKFLRMVRAEINEIRDAAEGKRKKGSRVPKTTDLRFAHASMQYSDKPWQMRADAKVIFARGYDIITGTEANRPAMREALLAAAKTNGYRLYVVRSVWVAVHKRLRSGNWESGFVPVITAGESRTGKHTDRGIAWVSFDTDELGRITVGAGHYLTKGRPVKGRVYSANLDLNERFGPAIEKWAAEKGAGSALVFYGGDQNIVDRTSDTFFGAPMTSAWDELGKYESTGHGNIDVIASYDPDARVKAKYIRALDDHVLPLFTDHYLVEAGYEVRHIKG